MTVSDVARRHLAFPNQAATIHGRDDEEAWDAF